MTQAVLLAGGVSNATTPSYDVLWCLPYRFEFADLDVCVNSEDEDAGFSTDPDEILDSGV